MISPQDSSIPRRTVRASWAVAILMIAPIFCLADQQSGETPGTFLWDAGSLATAKTALKAGDPMVVADVRVLVAEANAALSLHPVSVAVDKVRMAASGDPHDYFSIAPYWWPNPATPDGLPWVKRDGSLNPENSLDRLKLDTLVKAVRELSLAWYFTGEERYAEHAVAFLRTWFVEPDTRMNPNLCYSQAIPGTTNGRSIGMIDTVYYRELVDSIRLLEQSSALTSADRAALRLWFSDFLTWFLTSDFGRDEAAAHNNHSTWYHAQIGLYAAFTGREAEVKSIYENKLPDLAQQQIEPDGRQPLELQRTRSMHYSAYNLMAWEDIRVLGKRMGLDYYSDKSPMAQRVVAGLHYLAGYASPTSDWSYTEIKGGPERHRLVPLFMRELNFNADSKIEEALQQLPSPRDLSYLRLIYGYSVAGKK